MELLLSLYTLLYLRNSPPNCLWSNEMRNNHEVWATIQDNPTPYQLIDGGLTILYNNTCTLPPTL